MISNIHKGHYLQRGRGLGGIFSSLFRVLKPLFSKGAKHAIQATKHVLKDKDIKTALTDIKSAAVKSGTKALTDKIKQQEKALTRRIKEQEKALRKAKKRIASSLPSETVGKKIRKQRLNESIFS